MPNGCAAASTTAATWPTATRTDYVYFAGRLGDWMRVDGENLGTAPIERVLLRHPDVVEVAVYGIPAPDVGDRVMAALVLAEGAEFDVDGFRGVPGRPARPRPQAVAVVRPDQRRTAAHGDVQGDQAPAGGARAWTAPTGVADPAVACGGWATANSHRPPQLRELVECAWVVDGPPAPVRVLPDGCMDLIRMNGRVVVAGPDTTAFVSPRGREPFVGLRFRPGALPRLLGVPAAELRNSRVPLSDLRIACHAGPIAGRAGRRTGVRRARGPRPRHGRCRCCATSPAASAAARRRATWRARSVGRAARCSASAPPSTVTGRRRCAASCASAAPSRCWTTELPRQTSPPARGYADQPHLHREVRDLAGVSLATLRQDSGANRSTELPSGSATVA